MNRTYVESGWGAVVVVAGLVFVFLAYSAATFETAKGYPLKAPSPASTSTRRLTIRWSK